MSPTNSNLAKLDTVMLGLKTSVVTAVQAVAMRVSCTECMLLYYWKVAIHLV